MKKQEIGTHSAASNGSTVTNNTSPFMCGQTVVVMAHSKTGAYSGSSKLQESDDGTNWTDISGAAATGAGVDFFEITLKKYIRMANVSYTSGQVSYTMLGN